MRRRNLSIVVAVVFSWAGVLSWSKPVSDERLAKHFSVTWQRITASRSVSISNPAVGYTPGKTSERVYLELQVEIKDPKLIFGTGRSPVLTDLKDDAGHDLTLPKASPSQIHDQYEALRYRYRRQPASGPDTWIGKVRGFLGLSSANSNPTELVMELEPSELGIQFDHDTFPEGTRAIGLVNGYFHTLVAESIEYVDVPFKPSQEWVRLTPDTEIRVAEAANRGTSYRLNIEVGGSRGDRRTFYLTLGDSLPQRMVFGSEIIGEDGKPVRCRTTVNRWAGGMIGGRTSGSQISSEVATIRYKILVNPAHRKIPFTLKDDIPLPKP